MDSYSDHTNSIIKRSKPKSKLIPGKTDLLTLAPDIASEWDYERNNKDPSEYTLHSGKRVFWICKKGHRFETKICHRTRGDGKATSCPYCAGKKALTGVNDVATVRPDVLSEWDYEKNTIKPQELLIHSEKQCWWKCENGHSYQMMLCRKTQDKPYGCPICSNNRLLTGFNDLRTKFPKLAEEWDYEKNDTKPEDHIAGTHKKVWWICPQCNNHYYASIKDRSYGEEGCPNCAFYYKTSLPEQTVYFYIHMYFEDAINSYRPNFLNSMEIDIYIPSLKLGIEYDGESWHRNKKSDSVKSKILKDYGVSLIRIKETNGVNEYGDFAVIKSEYKDNIKTLNSALIELFKIINQTYRSAVVPDIDIDRDLNKILRTVADTKKRKSLAESGAVALVEWDYDKNQVTPDHVTPGSHKKVWWKCQDCGSSWQQAIKTKVGGQLHCPKCRRKNAGKKRIINRIASGRKTINDFPKLVKEWIDQTNPCDVLAGSEYKALWKCPRCGNEYYMSAKCRTYQKQSCPKCREKRISVTKTRRFSKI